VKHHLKMEKMEAGDKNYLYHHLVAKVEIETMEVVVDL